MEKINASIVAETVVKGSLIKTNKGYLFLSVALGKAVVDSVPVTALSPQSPLGRLLIGLRIGATAAVNNNQYIIESID